MRWHLKKRFPAKLVCRLTENASGHINAPLANWVFLLFWRASCEHNLEGKKRMKEKRKATWLWVRNCELRMVPQTNKQIFHFMFQTLNRVASIVYIHYCFMYQSNFQMKSFNESRLLEQILTNVFMHIQKHD